MSFRLNIPCANTIMICVKVLKKNWNKGSKWRLQQFMPYIKNFLHKIWTFQIVIVRWLGIGINHCEVNIWYAEIPTSKIVHKSLTSLHPRYFTHLTLNCKTNLVILWNLKMFLLIHEIAWLAKGNVDESSLVVGLPTCPVPKITATLVDTCYYPSIHWFSLRTIKHFFQIDGRSKWEYSDRLCSLWSVNLNLKMYSIWFIALLKKHP
jgi:hypothetical protein